MGDAMQCPHCTVALPTDVRFCAACGQPIPGAQGPSPSGALSSTWVVVLVACAAALVVVTVVGIIAAIAIPNLLNAIDRGKQKRTMADLRSVVTAMEAYAQDHGAYPVADDFATLQSQLVPKYGAALPTSDGWGHPFHISSSETDYEVVSPGKDGVLRECDRGETTDSGADICVRDGDFTQWPAGTRP